MNLRHLDYLRSAVALGGITQAARAHGVSQAAISLAMQSLERELGCTLFVRQGQRKLPSDRALAIARASEAVALAVQRLPQAAPRAQDSGRERPMLKAGLAPAAGLLYGPMIHRALLQAAPAQMLSVVTGAAPVMLEQLQRGELDIVIAPLPRRFPMRRLDRHVMYIGDPVIYARMGHPLQGARTLADVADADWVVAGAAGTPGNVIEEAFRVRRWAPPRIAVQCPDYRMLMRLIAGSDLLGVISNASLVSGDEAATVCPLSIREGLPRYDVCLFWSGHASVPSKHAVEAVTQALIEQAGRTGSRENPPSRTPA